MENGIINEIIGKIFTVTLIRFLRANRVKKASFCLMFCKMADMHLTYI